MVIELISHYDVGFVGSFHPTNKPDISLISQHIHVLDIFPSCSIVILLISFVFVCVLYLLLYDYNICFNVGSLYSDIILTLQMVAIWIHPVGGDSDSESSW